MSTGQDIAITGMAGRFPGASDLEAFWELVKRGEYALLPVDFPDPEAPATAGRWVNTNCLMEKAGHFDNRFFGISPREAAQIDAQHRLFLETAYEALEDAGLGAQHDRSVGVFAGANYSSFFDVQGYDHLLDALPALIGGDKDYLATRVSHRLNLTGPSLTVQTACSTSLVAIHQACMSLRAGECSAALAGGVSLTLPRGKGHFFVPGGILSHDGVCRPFDARASGTVFSEGVGVIALRRLEDALTAGDQIYAVIKGSAVNNDAARKAGFSAPSTEGQVEVLMKAYQAAGIAPFQVGYVEAHGTGTVVGDAVELASLTRVFLKSGAKPGQCYLGSVKANVGHLASAAGVAGLIKAALSVRDGVVPPHPNLEVPNPDFDAHTSPFRFAHGGTAWEGDGLRRCGVSSFGVGGANAHIVIEQPPPCRATPSARRRHLVGLSAKTDGALSTLRERLAAHTPASGVELEDIAHTFNTRRQVFDHRLAVVASDVGPFREALAPRSARKAVRVASRQPTLAFMYPGQGSQYPGMAASLYTAEPVFRTAFERCLGALSPGVSAEVRGLLLSETASEDDARRLQRTAIAQPALFSLQYALSRVLETWGLKPAAVIGHSLGEYVAACVSGVWTPEAAVRIVERRGALMEAQTEGAMLTVALSPDELLGVIPPTLDLAAVNAPDLCVVAGPTDHIMAFAETLTGQGIYSRRLQTSHAFHSRLMEPMLAPFAAELSRLEAREPKGLVISNVTGQPLGPDDVADPSYWTAHVRRPVLFATGLEAAQRAGCDTFVEVGPGRALTTIARRCALDGRDALLLNTMPEARRRGEEADSLLECLGRLWEHGAEVDLARLYDGEDRRTVRLPGHPFQPTDFGFGPHGMDGKPRTRAKDRRPVSEWLYTADWRRETLIREVEGPASSTCLIFAPTGHPFMSAVARENMSRGATIVTVHPGQTYNREAPDRFTIDPAADGHYVRLFEDLQAAGLDPTHVLHAWSLASDDHGLASTQTHDIRLLSVLRCLNAMRVLRRAPRLVMLSSNAFDVLGDEPLAPQNAALAACAQVIPQENPGLSCRMIDVSAAEMDAWPDDMAKLILCEALSPATSALVALRNGRRWVPCYRRPAPAEDRAPPERPIVRAGGDYLIIGGLSDLGLIMADWLARSGAGRVTLTTRSALPPSEAWRAMARDEATPGDLRHRLEQLVAIEDRGCRVQVLWGDPGRHDDVLRFRAACPPELHGLIYAAGHMALESTHASPVDVEGYLSHVRAKALGVQWVEEVFAGAAFDFKLLLSSISSVLGGLGHCGYAASNLMAEAVATGAAKRDWTIVSWDLWRSRKIREAQGHTAIFRTAIKADEGLEALERILRGWSPGHVIVSTTDLDHRISQWVGMAEKAATAEHQNSPALANDPDQADKLDWEGELETIVGNIWVAALGLDGLGRDDDFFDAGGDSLLAVQIAGQLREKLEVSVPLEEIFTSRTIRTFATAVEQRMNTSTVCAPGIRAHETT